MTVDSAGPAVQRSVHVVRARRLLRAGLAGAAAAALPCLLVAGLVHGRDGVLSAAAAVVVVLFFYGVGQYVMVRTADASAWTLMAVSMVSYGFRAGVLGVLLWAFLTYADRWPDMIPVVLFATTVAVVVGWLAAEIWTFAHLRIGVFDAEYAPPSGAGGVA